MATTAELLVEGLDRVHGLVEQIADGLSDAQLAFRIDGSANSIGWLLWHLTRVQDDHVAELAGVEQVWTSAGWADRFALPFAASEIGYGQSSDDVAQVLVSSGNLIGYHDAVHAASVEYVRGLVDADLDDVVDDAWDPPVTRAVRLISVLSDDLQHAGQAAFVRGLLA